MTARVIQVGELMGLLDRTPSIALELSRMLSERLRWANERRLDFAAFSAPVRLRRVLLHIAERYGQSTPEGESPSPPR